MDLDTLQGQPTIETLPSGLKRITRVWKLRGDAMRAAAINSYLTAYGSPDLEFTSAFQVDQRVDRRSEQGLDVTLTKVFQELADNALTATTEVAETTTSDGRRVTRTTYLCKAGQVAALRPAVSTGTGIFQVDAQSVGPVATVVVSSIAITSAGFVLSDSTDTRNNGKLLLRTIRTVAAAPATPSGFTATGVSTSTQDGYVVYTSTFAKGAGRISTDTETKYAGKLTLTTIRYLGADDGTTPSGTLLSTSSVAQDGFTQTTAVYAAGSGTISTATSSEYGGSLTRTTITSLNAVPTGTGAVIDTKTDVRDDGTIYTYTFVSGSGVIAESSSSNGPLTTGSISYLNGEPTLPTGAVVTDTRLDSRDGFYIKTISYASGSGQLSSSESSEFGGLLVRRTVVQLNGEPTISGNVIATKVDIQNGQRIISKTAISVTAGVIATSTSANGPLNMGSISYLNGEPTVPTGAVVTDTRIETHEGYFVKTISWASGSGTLSTSTRTEYGGKLVFTTVTTLNALPSGTGQVLNTRIEIQHGQFIRTWTFLSATATLLDSTEDSRGDGSVIRTYISYGSFYTTGTGTQIESDILPMAGYQLYKTVFYTKPSDYTVPVNVTRVKPGVMGWNADGPAPSRQPVIVNIAATASVTFSTTPADLPAETPINANCIAHEFAQFDDGKQPEFLNEIHELRNYYAPASGAAGSNADYRGRHASGYSVDFVGQTDQAGSSLVLSATREPYFRAGGLIVWKQTVVTGTL